MTNETCLYSCIDNNSCEGCPRWNKMSYLLEKSDMPFYSNHIKTAIIEEFDIEAIKRLKSIKNNIVSYVEDGNNLFIATQNSSAGLTMWSVKLVAKFFDLIWASTDFRTRGYFLYVPEFIAKLRSFKFIDSDEYKEIYENIRTADIVIWDSITNISIPPELQVNMFSLIGSRYKDRKSNIFNGFSPENLIDIVGEPIAHLLERSEIIELNHQYK